MNKYARPFVLIILLGGLSLAGMLLLERFGQLNLRELGGNSLLLPGLLCQVLASTLFVFAWRRLLQEQAGVVLTLSDAVHQIGVTLLGKYLPGKIWGLVGRALLLKSRGLPLQTITSLLLLDQVLTFASGIALATLLLAAIYVKFWAAVLTALVIPLLELLRRSCNRLTLPALKWLSRSLSRQFNASEPALPDAVNVRAFYDVLVIYLLHWLCTALALALLVYPYLSEHFVEYAVLIAVAVPAGMLTGFVALWAPGGIGVREAVMVAVLSLQLPVDTAILVALAYRAVCVAVDLVLGGAAVLLTSRRGTSTT